MGKTTEEEVPNSQNHSYQHVVPHSLSRATEQQHHKHKALLYEGTITATISHRQGQASRVVVFHRSPSFLPSSHPLFLAGRTKARLFTILVTENHFCTTKMRTVPNIMRKINALRS